MLHTAPHKARFTKLGYGALALYAALLVAVGLGVYGINVTQLMMLQRSSERAREEVRTGHMLIPTKDNAQCRSIHFNNETQALSRETLIPCKPETGRAERSSGGSFSVFRDGFVNR